MKYFLSLSLCLAAAPSFALPGEPPCQVPSLIGGKCLVYATTSDDAAPAKILEHKDGVSDPSQPAASGVLSGKHARGGIGAKKTPTDSAATGDPNAVWPNCPGLDTTDPQFSPEVLPGTPCSTVQAQRDAGSKDPFANITKYAADHNLTQYPPGSPECSGMPQENIFCWTQDEQAQYIGCALNENIQTFGYFQTSNNNWNNPDGAYAVVPGKHKDTRCK